MRTVLFAAAAIAALIVAGFSLSPWPGVLLVRAAFDRGAAAASDRLAPRVPAAVTTTTHRYDPDDPAALLDIYRLPDASTGLPVIVWVHGGGFVSGQRADVANYLKILAGRGFIVVNVDYTIAPEARYPTPVRQLATALGFLHGEAAEHDLDGARFVLAGDSAGAQIAAQTAAAATDAAYGQQLGVKDAPWRDALAGVSLFCGVYDIAGLGEGAILGRWFVQVTGWAYSGDRNWRRSEVLDTFDLTARMSPAFPAAFVTVGNADPLEPQSRALARTMEDAGVPVSTLFFPPDHEPALGHEYQFDLDSAAGQQALDALDAWLRAL